MTDQFVFLKSFRTEIEAQIVKGRLQAEEIEVTIRDNNIAGMNWLYSNAVGGVKLFVIESQLAEAKKILSEPITNQQESTWDPCPKCESDSTEYFADSKFSWFSYLLLGFPLFFPKKKLHCKNCNYWWNI